MDAQGNVTLTTYVPPDVAGSLRDHARAADRSIAAELRMAIRHHLKASSPNEIAKPKAEASR